MHAQRQKVQVEVNGRLRGSRCAAAACRPTVPGFPRTHPRVGAASSSPYWPCTLTAAAPALQHPLLPALLLLDNSNCHRGMYAAGTRDVSAAVQPPVEGAWWAEADGIKMRLGEAASRFPWALRRIA